MPKRPNQRDLAPPPNQDGRPTLDGPAGAPEQDAPSAHQSSAAFVAAHKAPTGSEKVYGIGELADELGTTARAIRFYEEKGLLSPARVGQQRIYTRRERARLQLVLRGKSLGLTLREMREYLDLYGENGQGRQQQLELAIARSQEMIVELKSKREALDRTLAELEVIRRVSRERLAALKAGSD